MYKPCDIWYWFIVSSPGFPSICRWLTADDALATHAWALSLLSPVAAVHCFNHMFVQRESGGLKLKWLLDICRWRAFAFFTVLVRTSLTLKRPSFQHQETNKWTMMCSRWLFAEASLVLMAGNPQGWLSGVWGWLFFSEDELNFESPAMRWCCGTLQSIWVGLFVLMRSWDLGSLTKLQEQLRNGQRHESIKLPFQPLQQS